MDEQMKLEAAAKVEMIRTKLAELKKLKALEKEWKKEGLIPKTERVVKEKTPAFILLAEQFKSVVDSNLDAIKGFFEASKTAEKPLGNTGINFRVKDEVFYVQILSDSAMKAKKPVKKAAETTE